MCILFRVRGPNVCEGLGRGSNSLLDVFVGKHAFECVPVQLADL